MSPRITGPFAATLLAGALLLGLASPASALDAYRDRRGLLYGFGVGAGAGQSDRPGDDREIGYNLWGRVGGGVNKHLTLDLEIGLWLQSEDNQSTTLFTSLVGGNLFLIDGLYLRAMGGVSSITVDFAGAEDSKTGLAVGGGAGYEFFANADLAVGVGADLQHHAYDTFSFQLISFGVRGTMY